MFVCDDSMLRFCVCVVCGVVLSVKLVMLVVVSFVVCLLLNGLSMLISMVLCLSNGSLVLVGVWIFSMRLVVKVVDWLVNLVLVVI